MKIFFFCILLFVCISQSVLSSDYDPQSQHYGGYLDSIAKTGNLEVLRSEILKLRNNKDINSLILDSYQQILNFKTFFLDKDSSKLKQFVTRKQLEEQYFSSSFAGENAFTSYQTFLEYIEAKEYLEAAKYYFIANFFRTKRISWNIINIRNVYNRAEILYDSGEYQRSLDYILASKIDPGNNYILKDYNDDLNALVISNQKKLKAIANKELYWSSKKTLNKNWQFSIGTHATFQPAHNDLNFDFNTQSPSTIYNGILSPKKNNIGISLEAVRSISESFAIGADIMKTQYSYSSELDLSLLYFDYSYDIITSHFKTIYFLRKHVGFRPYISVGLGYFKGSRDESQVRTIVNQVGNDYTLSKQSISSMQSVYEFGIQFIQNENSKMFLNIQTSFFLNHTEQPEIKSSLMTISMRIGLLY